MEVLTELNEIVSGRRSILPRGKNRRRFLALALMGEAGELGNQVKKQWRDGKDRTPKTRAELFDVYAYGFMMGVDLGLTPEQVLQGVVRKLRAVERRKAFKTWHKPKAKAPRKKGRRRRGPPSVGLGRWRDPNAR